MSFCSVTFYQIKPGSENNYLDLLNETSRRRQELKKYEVNQSIIGQNKPRFTVSIALWNEEQNYKSWMKSKVRIKYLNRHVNFYGDIYNYNVIVNETTEISGNECGLYCTFSRYVIKTGTQEDYLKTYKNNIADANFKDFGVKQTIFLRDSKNNSVFSRVTIWESKEDLLKWRAAGTQIALMDKYLDHYIETMEFNILSILFP